MIPDFIKLKDFEVDKSKTFSDPPDKPCSLFLLVNGGDKMSYKSREQAKWARIAALSG